MKELFLKKAENIIVEVNREGEAIMEAVERDMRKVVGDVEHIENTVRSKYEQLDRDFGARLNRAEQLRKSTTRSLNGTPSFDEKCSIFEQLKAFFASTSSETTTSDGSGGLSTVNDLENDFEASFARTLSIKESLFGKYHLSHGHL